MALFFILIDCCQPQNDMTNSELLAQITLYAQLLELQGENPFKIRSYHTAVANLEKIDAPLAKMTALELEQLQGVGKAIALKLDEARTTGQFHQLTEQLTKVPMGVVEMLDISGLGVKKVQTLWKEHQIQDTDQLLQACEQNEIAKIKGFGEKTQENIKQALLFLLKNADKFHLPEANTCAKQIREYLQNIFPSIELKTTGDLAQGYEVVHELRFLMTNVDKNLVFEALNEAGFLVKEPIPSGIFTWRGKFLALPIPLEVRYVSSQRLGSEAIIVSSAPLHLALKPQNKESILQIAVKQDFESELKFYNSFAWQEVPAEIREGTFEASLASQNALPNLLNLQDLQGVLHAHSTYSDGKHTLADLAQTCKAQGYQYLGITDHSKTAFYANGLSEGRIIAQHKEIDELNKELTPFKIFNGIESDILPDGSLDYA